MQQGSSADRCGKPLRGVCCCAFEGHVRRVCVAGDRSGPPEVSLDPRGRRPRVDRKGSQMVTSEAQEDRGCPGWGRRHGAHGGTLARDAMSEVGLGRLSSE